MQSSVHNEVTEGQHQLTRYMIRATFALEKTEYIPPPRRGMVVYRSKMHRSLKRNYQVMPGAQWLALLLQHVPDKGEHQVRYYGWYSIRRRGKVQTAGRKLPYRSHPGRNPGGPGLPAQRPGRLGAVDPKGLRIPLTYAPLPDIT